jgi:hypothetical protein
MKNLAQFFILQLLVCQTFQLTGQPVYLFNTHFGGSMQDEMKTMVYDPSGYIYLAGVTKSTDHDIHTSFGGTDGWVIKTDTSGHLIWSKTFGGPARDELWDLCLSNDTTLIMVGFTQSDTPWVSEKKGLTDIWVVCADTAGNEIWNRCFGSPGNESARAVRAVANGHLLVAGSINGTGGQITSHFGSDDIWLIEIDSTGSLISEHTYGTLFSEQANHLEISPDGNIIISAVFEGSGCVMYSIDKNFYLQWNKILGNNNPTYAYAISAESKRTLIAGQTNMTGHPAGFGGDDACLWEIDSVGVSVINHYYGGTGLDNIRSIFRAEDSTHLFFAQTNSSNGLINHPGYGGKDAWVFKTDSLFSFLQGIRFGTDVDDEPIGLVQLPDNRYLFICNASPVGNAVFQTYGSLDVWMGIIMADSTQSITSPEVIPNNFHAWPVPAYSCVTLSFPPGQKTREILVLDATGRLAGKFLLLPQTSETRLNFSGFPFGVYFLRDNLSNSTIKIEIQGY